MAAEDPDSGDFGEIRYEFDTNSNSKQITNLFMINSKSGKIFTLEGMRELDKRYIIIVKQITFVFLTFLPFAVYLINFSMYI